ncbi:MAG: O-antigen ligase family protein [Rhodobacter sp.]|nr:O-antigen ligase family protein [Rhodobacter sp.]
MWQAGSLLIILSSLYVVLRQVRHLRGDTLAILAIALIWVRLAAAALGEVALDTKIAGISLIALSTLAAACVGLLLVPFQLVRNGWVAPFYVFVGFGVLSAVLNGAIGAVQSFAVLWLYFIVVALLLYRALLVHGPRTVLGCLMAVFALPFAMQLMSFLLNMPKVGPDGTLSYIGGYGHEAVYALVAVGALWLAATYPWSRVSKGLAVVGAIVVGLLLANYRTIIIAILPLLLAYLLFRTGPSPARALRRSIIPVIVLAVLLPAILPENMGARFAEIGSVVGDFGELTKRPEAYTASEKDLLSARAYIWSAYIYGFLDAEIPQLLIGHGPEARAPGVTVHAHNEYLRILYEFGALGAILWFGTLLHHLVLALRAQPLPVGAMTAAGFVTVALAALGTSLFNRPEGIILLALLCSTTWYLQDQRGSVPRRDAPRLRLGPGEPPAGPNLG